jgi:hypothetical protein
MSTVGAMTTNIRPLDPTRSTIAQEIAELDDAEAEHEDTRHEQRYI